MLARLDLARRPRGRWCPRSWAAWPGYLGYDLGLRLEPRAVLVPSDQELPELRLALHDWAIAWDRRSGLAYLGGRAVDGDRIRLDRAPGGGVERIATGLGRCVR